ncbi:DUF4025 domain-containing protein [Oceanobacillus sp. 143]|uniref:DUF4025 domain-containing protein n=1 Tax=Oceanobacillus zhaokaii TaxID=2052660 RepID=A0A345PM16_9BACI|nr:YozQ family protein [Oceanobacillus zhaokaii]AXI11046.1 DUF4025 domain-containing protein [Oceanobacillus zhaokaii]QGS69836.1 DUF4025 domain-containing protein [Oceanobacillus sp. 143]
MAKKAKVEEVADKVFDRNKQEEQDEASKGLAETHKQVSDTLSDGTIDYEKKDE